MPWDRRIEPFLNRYPVLRAIGHTPLVPVSIFGDELPDVEVLAKMECLNPGGSLKDRPVLYMLLAALANGRLQPGKTILDSSSGNAGIAYAMVGRIIGYPVEIVIPNNASTERKKRLLAHGAQLIYTDALKGYDEALREVHLTIPATLVLTPYAHLHDYVVLVLPLMLIAANLSAVPVSWWLTAHVALVSWLVVSIDFWFHRWIDREGVRIWLQSRFGEQPVAWLWEQSQWNWRFIAMLLPLGIVVCLLSSPRRTLQKCSVEDGAT